MLSRIWKPDETLTLVFEIVLSELEGEHPCVDHIAG